MNINFYIAKYKYIEREGREKLRWDNLGFRREDSESRALVLRSDLVLSELLNEFSTSYYSSEQIYLFTFWNPQKDVSDILYSNKCTGLLINSYSSNNLELEQFWFTCMINLLRRRNSPTEKMVISAIIWCVWSEEQTSLQFAGGTTVSDEDMNQIVKLVSRSPRVSFLLYLIF